MRIAVLASNFIKIPPTPKDIPSGYSGAPEEIVHRITEGLVKIGHKVTLFASGDSKTSASLNCDSLGNIDTSRDNVGKKAILKARCSRDFLLFIWSFHAYVLAGNHINNRFFVQSWLAAFQWFGR